MKKVFVIVGIVAALIIGVIFYNHFTAIKKFQVVFMNVGQGDSALIFFGNGQKMLVDCGADKKVLSRLATQLSFFDRKIDYLLITHFDNDHYGGCMDVIKRYQIGTVIDNGAKKFSDAYWEDWDKKSKEKGIKNKVVDDYEVMKIGSSTMEFLSPDSALVLADKNKDSNNQSIVFRLTNQDKKFLFVGDAEVPLEIALINRYCVSTSTCPKLASDYLKVGHHGSDSSSGDDFLTAVNPRYAIISVGPNTFGHPSLRVMSHLRRQGIDIWRTDERGDIIVR